jgi:hypothetical protein
LNNVSETRLAALNASMPAPVPKALAANTWRANPTRLLSTNASITVPAARAICLFADGCSVTNNDYKPFDLQPRRLPECRA